MVLMKALFPPSSHALAASLVMGIGLIHYRQDVKRCQELEGIKRTMFELVHERDEAREEVKEKRTTIAVVQEERDRLSGRTEELTTVLEGRIRVLNDQLGRSQSQTNSLTQPLERRQTEMQIVTNELAQIKAKHSHTVALLDTRSSELRGAQAFLTKADSTSGADVVRMVESLGAEILQIAAFIADYFVFEER